MGKADPIRRLAFDVLIAFEKAGQDHLKADRLLQQAIESSQHPVSSVDRAFLQALVMGTLRHWFRLDSWLEQLTERPLKQMEPAVRVLLRLGIFQLYGLSQVPAYAAINTTVDLAKQRKNTARSASFINAILRKAQHCLLEAGFSVAAVEQDAPFYLQQSYGWPPTWSQALLVQYAFDAVEQMAQICQQPAPLTLRINTLKGSIDSYQRTLQTQAIASRPIDAHLPEAILIEEHTGPIQHLPGYAEGRFYVQDPASMWVSHLLQPKPGDRILDLCAAPGSKTTHMAAICENQAFITAIEPKKSRIALLNENLQRLGVENVIVTEIDGLLFESSLALATDEAVKSTTETHLFDKVLVDAPCSGSGTIRRHPEILLHLSKMKPDALAQTQLALLNKGWECLRPDGLLVYSTCSLFKVENQDIIDAFLAQHPEALVEHTEQRLIQAFSDGFFAARLRKKV